MIQPKYIAFMFMICLFGVNKGIAQNEWITYKVDKGLAFSVEVPGEMEKTVKNIKTSVGELEVLNYAFQGKEDDPNYLYLINLVKYPEDTFVSDSLDFIEEFLNNSLESSIEKVKGELIYSSDIEKGWGKLFRIKYNGGDAIIKGKSYIRKDVFISIQVFTVESRSLNREMDVFLDSFKTEF